MSELKFHWYLPTNGGDSRDVIGGGPGVAVENPGRPASVEYLSQITRSAEQLGFEAALTPTGSWCNDAWITTAMISSVSRKLKFLVAFRPGAATPFLSAQMAASFQNLSHGRLLLNVVTGGETAEQQMFGDYLDKEQRYRRTGEFLGIVRRLWAGESVTFDGEHLSVTDAKLGELPDPVPDIYFGGSSPAAIDVAAQHADVYLTWGEPPEAAAEKIVRVEKAAAEHGRQLRFGIRLHTIARATSEAAWREADRLIEAIPEGAVEGAQAAMKSSESEGQRRMRELHGGRVDQLEVYPNLWAGVGLVRGGAGTAMVGSYAEIADLIEKYREIGISEFVLSGYPHLEEAYWFGEGVLPELQRRELWTAQA
ncbi:LLM class flavin-dependent oxidoreductase [Gordonia zhaorongruii]|uniref:LLM class flavin-dependent oxidoreductase n=1 Tax=Gordonia zhaorongruii TaxID=2597659 RepID=UPI001642C84B|nr:LLM class flavin-dependent oxidoreductase [Gordonia zhaorongruii]